MLTKQAEFEFIQEYSKEFSLSILFKLTSVSRAGYYKWMKKTSTTPSSRDEELYRYISDIFHEFKGTYGVVRIKKELLNRYGWIVNHKCIRRIMHKYHLICNLPNPKFKRRPQPNGNIPNVLNREFHATQSLQKLCMVITYDVCESQNMAQVYRVLDQLSYLPLAENALLHTDQGCQFTNKNDIKKVADIGLIQSMSRRGNCKGFCLY